MDYNEFYSKSKEIIVDYLRLDEEEIKPETNIVDELCADSIALVELGFRFSEEFSVPMIDPSPDLFVFKNLVDHLYKASNSQN